MNTTFDLPDPALLGLRSP